MKLLLRAHMSLSSVSMSDQAGNGFYFIFSFFFSSMANNHCKAAIHAGMRVNGGVVVYGASSSSSSSLPVILTNLLHLLIWFFSVSVMDSLLPHSSPSAHHPPSGTFFYPSTICTSSVYAFTGSESFIHPSIHPGNPLSPSYSVHYTWTSSLFPGSATTSHFLHQPCLFSFFPPLFLLLCNFARLIVSLTQCLFSLLLSKKEIILPNLTFVPSLIYFPPHPLESMQRVFLIFHPSFSLVFSFHSIVFTSHVSIYETLVSIFHHFSSLQTLFLTLK